MLGLTSVLAGVLAAQAVSAARGHRASAERVLQDYAALGAEGLAQRLKSGLGLAIDDGAQCRGIRARQRLRSRGRHPVKAGR